MRTHEHRLDVVGGHLADDFAEVEHADAKAHDEVMCFRCYWPMPSSGPNKSRAESPVSGYGRPMPHPQGDFLGVPLYLLDRPDSPAGHLAKLHVDLQTLAARCHRPLREVLGESRHLVATADSLTQIEHLLAQCTRLLEPTMALVVALEREASPAWPWASESSGGRPSGAAGGFGQQLSPEAKAGLARPV